MTYMQRGNYVAVINPLFWSEVMSDDPTLQWGVYDTVTKTFFSLSKEASAATFSPLIHLKDLTVQRMAIYMRQFIRQNAQLQPLLRLHINVL